MEQQYKDNIARKTKLEPELKPKFEEYIAGRTKLRKQRLNEIAKREKTTNNNLFKKHFEYSSPSDMYKNLNTTEDIEENKTKVNKIKNNLTGLMMKFKNNPTDNVKKLEIEITWWKLSNSFLSLMN